MSIFIAGGVYNNEFFLVRPTGEKALPYVSSHPHGMLRNSTKHHSHYYRLEGESLYLENESWEISCAKVGAPRVVNLSQDQLKEIEESFKKYDYK